MEGCWDVRENGEKVGSCWVKAEGLYLRIRCSCGMRPGMVRLYWDREPLGVLIPQGDRLVLETRQAKKRFLGLEPRFLLEPVGEKRGERFVPLCPEEPFSYLEYLQNARFSMRNGQPGLVMFTKN